jgi:transitional endoplasmic reticulum ATPase
MSREGIQSYVCQISQAYVSRSFPRIESSVELPPSKDFLGDEYAIAEVFRKARQESPCVVILEDIDSQINNQNRSFFLNELDGLERNDGLLLVGSTNHLDRLDPGLSTRPSRFDRK